MSVSVAPPPLRRRGQQGSRVQRIVACALAPSLRVVSYRREGVHGVSEVWWRPLANTHGHQPIEPPVLRRPRQKHRGRPERGGGWIRWHRVAHPLPHLERDPGQAPVGHDHTVAIVGIEGEPYIRRPLPSRPEAAGLIPPGAYHPSE